MNWTVKDREFRRDAVEKNGSKYIIGNGYMGFRGTLEEFSARELVACTLSGLYDRVGSLWREPVNAPNAFLVRVSFGGRTLSTLDTPVEAHEQGLNLQAAEHFRDTRFSLGDGRGVRLRIERFLSVADVHVGAMRIALTADSDGPVVLETGIDGGIWDLNGPHLENFQGRADDGLLVLASRAQEKKIPVVVAEALTGGPGKEEIVPSAHSIVRRIKFDARAGETYTLTKSIAVFTGLDGTASPAAAAAEACRRAAALGYDGLLAASKAVWARRWADSDVRIEGDDEAQLALRYSIYHLLIIAPTHSDRVSIPARGLSGQVYKGAVFWDTEIYMMPFFDHTQPAMARNLVRYRYHTLDGARRKAAEEGYRGAFYAWESQDTGDDACTLFNVSDVFTGRPIRTYFRDRQIHVSADVALAVWRHYQMSGDAGILADGGVEIILECARFFHAWAYFKPQKNRFEMLGVTGPDEYHEPVNNDAFTNAMAAETVRVAFAALDALRASDAGAAERLIARLGMAEELAQWRDCLSRLYQPAPDAATGVIEQFDGYHRLEDVSLEALKKRVLDPKEYWGGGQGIATSTKIIKQADVVLMLHLFSDRYPAAIKRANWDYYEPRTEHGSSLSPCVYALVAADLGDTEWAYRYFMRTATVDLSGNSKQYAGPLYIGGTHPAANGGAWMAAVFGFGGLKLSGDRMLVAPRLPAKWQRLSLRFCWRGNWYGASFTPTGVTLAADATNAGEGVFEIEGQTRRCRPGETIDSRRSAQK